MSYKVLYRKYRPSNFSEVVGQEATVQILKNSIINEKISHAYLFAGPRGTGKTSMARIFAKAINCLEPVDGEACGKCLNCQNFASSPDIIEIDAASNNGVDEIRELINNVKLMPSAAKYKVYIIDEVHMLSQSAFNALLLTLEEPPSHVIFILATTNMENVPITIVSRCQKYEFFRINDDLIVKQLQNICDKEKIAYDVEGLQEITVLADGGMRDALSMLDQLSKENKKIDLDLVIKELGSISLIKIKELINYLDTGNIEKILSIITELKKTNLNYKIVIKKIIELLSQKAVEVLKTGQYQELSYSRIKKIIFELNDCLNKININVNPYIIVQMILLDNVREIDSKAKEMPLPPKEAKNDTKTIEKDPKEEPKKINLSEESEKDVSSSDSELKKETDELTKLKKIRINNCFVGANKEVLTNLKNNWTAFLNKTTSQIKGLLSDAIPVAAAADYVIISSSIEHQNTEINENLATIEEAYTKYSKDKIKFIALSAPEWENERNIYIKNIKEGYKYQLKEEKSVFPVEDDLEKIAASVFAQDKIEIN